MPDPKEFENQDDWMAACVPMAMQEGADNEAAVGKCMGMWKEHMSAKANTTITSTSNNGTTTLTWSIAPAVKAVGDWELDVRGNPYGPDSDRQFFDENTEIVSGNEVPVVYYHGIRDDQKGLVDKPVVIGKATRGERRADGQWWRVVLDKANEYARKVWEAAKAGSAVASSGAIDYLSRLEIGGKLQPYDKQKPGRIAVWHMGELSLWDWRPGFNQAHPYAVAVPALKATYEQAGISLVIPSDKDVTPPTANKPEGNAEAAKAAQSEGEEAAVKTKTLMENYTMDELETKVQAAVKAALEAQAAENAKKAEQEAAIKAEAERIANEKIEAFKAEAAKNNRLPMGDGAPYQTQFSDTAKYDHLSPGDLGLAIEVMQSTGKVTPSRAAIKALAIKLLEDKRDLGPDLAPDYSHRAMKAAGLPMDKDAYKAATDPMYTGGTTDGGNWVHTSYAREIWSALRSEPRIVAKIPSQVIPDGSKSVTIPLEGVDLTWYSAPEATSTDSNLKVPAALVDGSQITTPTNKEITVGKMGARGLYSGELTEDSIIAFAPQLRTQLVVSGKENLEHLVIDGDTETGATTNINDIGGTPTSTGTNRDLFLITNGFRKLALVTNTANSRAGGSLDEDDYLETMWLMGTAGLAGADMSKCSFIVDPNVYKQSLKMASVKTKDVWANATLESGVLTRLWGYELLPSWFMHYKSTVRKANSAGKVDQDTTANNAYGSIVAVRWDQWKFAYKRQMTIELTRIANADSYEIVAWARVGLGFRDNEASAITYGLSV